MSSVTLIKLNATESTNDMLKAAHAKGQCKDGDLYWTSKQTKGRGQQGKKWESQPGKNLAWSIFKSFHELHVSQAYRISATISLGIVEALTLYNIKDLTVKWPNDIMAGNRKMGGILIENSIQGLWVISSIIGVGINVNQTDFKNLPRATSMALETNKNFELEHVLVNIARVLNKKLDQTLEAKHSSVVDEFSKKLYGLEKRCLFQSKTRKFEATVKGISASGAILVERISGKLEALTYPEYRMNYGD